MASSLYDGLDDVELSKGGSGTSGGSAGGWVLGGTSGASSNTSSTTAGIGRLVAAASGNSTTLGGFTRLVLLSQIGKLFFCHLNHNVYLYTQLDRWLIFVESINSKLFFLFYQIIQADY